MKRDRLTRQEFTTLLSKGRRVHGETLSLVVRPARKTKCGVVVSRKTARKAVVRHKLRRQVYQILRDEGVLDSKLHLAVLLRQTAAQQPFSVLQSEIQRLFTTLK